MSAGIGAFEGQRLAQIRDARGLTSSSLAERIGVSPSTISQYERGNQKPRQSNLDRLSQALNVPAAFFFESPRKLEQVNYFRSMSAATKAGRDKAKSRRDLFLEVLEYLLEYFDFPSLELPDLGMPDNIHAIEPNMIESAASQVRQSWLLGYGPVANVVKAMESKGIVVWRTQLEAETLDAFSVYIEPHPIIVLSSEKENYFRSRFDAAHELGHLVLHRNISEKVLRKTPEFRKLEGQAHHFASAFLLPAQSYTDELWDCTLDAFRSMKPRWRTSIATQIMRASQLRLIDEYQAKRLWMNLSRRKWRRREPLDDSYDPEEPGLLKKCFDIMFSKGIKTREQLITDLQMYHSDIESFANTEPGFISGLKPDEPRVKLSSKVLQFSRK